MMKGNIQETIRRKLKDKFDLDNIIIFGSAPTDNSNKNSDIDLLVILNQEGFIKSYSERIKKRVLIYQALIEIVKSMPVDILVYTKDEWQELIKSGSSFHNKILKEGISL